MPDIITKVGELEALYGAVSAASMRKETTWLTPAYRRLLEASPFFVVATAGQGGLDCSPRGDPKGSIRVLDSRTIAFADRRGNNRIDSLRNLIVDPRIALLFLIPGVGETLRINGRAAITRNAALLESFAVDGKLPVCAVTVSIEAVYFQCARAIARSRLWDASQHIARHQLPTAGEMLRSADSAFDAQAYDAALPARQASTLY